MAQKQKKKKRSSKLCVKCGVVGSSAANKLCSKCFNSTAEASAVAATSTSSGGSKPKIHVFGEKSFRSSSSTSSSLVRSLNLPDTSRELRKEPTVAESVPWVKREVNRCSGCGRKVHIGKLHG